MAKISLRGCLGAAMILGFAPSGDGCLVAEEREREDFAGLVQALEPLNRDKAINPFKDRPQRRGNIQ